MAIKSKIIPYIFLILSAVIFGILAPRFFSEYGLHIAVISLFYVLMASAWNLVAGFTGQVSFAQAGFASIGAYASALLTLHATMPIFISAIFGAGIAALFGWLLGCLCLPFGGKYLSLVTLSFSEILRIILTNEERLTRGTQGLQVRGLFADYSKANVLYLFLLVSVLILSVIRFLIQSNLGLLFRAVMNDEVATASLGVNTTQIRVFAFMLSSAISGLAGALYGHYLNLVTPDLGSLDQMFLILAMTLVGGKGTWLGPVIGAVLLETLSEQIRSYGEYSTLVFGLITLIMVRYAPQGIIGKLSRKIKTSITGEMNA